MRRQFRPLPAALLFFVVAFFGCCQGAKDTVTITNSSGENLKVRVEIADTPEERAQGLMFRETVPEGTGMLFIFPEEVQTSFWMKDTPATLDLLFIRNEQIVSIIENAVPFSEELLTPDTTYTSVLEVPGGYAARHDVGVGETVALPTTSTAR